MRPPTLALAEQAPPPPRQRRSIRTRNRLRRAAREVFATRGYDGSSVEAITQRASMAVGAFYLHYSSKRQLLVDLMAELLHTLAERSFAPPPDRRTRALRQFFTNALRTDRENYGVIRAWQEACEGDRELAALRVKVDAWTHARVLRVLMDIRQRGLARRRSRTELEAFARVLDRHLWMLLGRAAQMSRADVDREAAILSDMTYHYLLRDAGAGK